MRPAFVKKQMIQQSTEAAVFGQYRADKFEVKVEEDEDDEPVSLSNTFILFYFQIAAKYDVFQQNVIPKKIKAPEFCIGLSASTSGMNFGSSSS